MRAGSNWRHLNGLSLGMMGDPVRCLPKVVHPDVAALKLQHNRIVNDPNSWFDDPRDLIAAIQRIVHVSVNTTRVVESLPEAVESA